ncbi:hypothetical protein TIFTF001_006411 [Ficus carica]|uniref:H15 domain-containing protein n=1 Tax=Ficus carica TaxID=3494 RepID=A0AA87ZIS9_FICCA|nr:hypothetical protein TIFTF001_006411 [Ficus carica]
MSSSFSSSGKPKSVGDNFKRERKGFPRREKLRTENEKETEKELGFQTLIKEEEEQWEIGSKNGCRGRKKPYSPEWQSTAQDKWRNLSPSYSGQSSKENPSPKIKSIVPASPVNIQSSAPAASIRRNAASDADMDDPSNSILDGKSASRYNTMIFEAISTMKDANGSDIGAILNFIKVQDGYKIRKETPSGAKIPTPKPKDIGPGPLQNSVLIAKNLKDVSDTAAYKVADAENKSFLAAEAIKEAERILKITEDTETILQLMKDIHEQCSRGEIVVLLTSVVKLEANFQISYTNAVITVVSSLVFIHFYDMKLWLPTYSHGDIASFLNVLTGDYRQQRLISFHGCHNELNQP